MRPAALALLAAAALLFAPAGAFAKAPKAGETPTVEEIYQQAQKSIEDAAKAAIEKARDPLKEAIDAYRDRKTPLTDYQTLVACINNVKDKNVQPYRVDAAQALVYRFSHEDENDPQNRAIRRAIALGVLELMKAPKTDDPGLHAIETILYAWWRAKMQIDIRWKTSDKQDDRAKAYVKMKKYLDKGEN